MRRSDRLREILTLLETHDRVEVDSLAGYFDVSAETIRRDLGTLSEKELLRKVHGGAVKFQTAQENSLAARTGIISLKKLLLLNMPFSLLIRVIAYSSTQEQRQ